MDAIFKRVSIRKFEDTPVEPEKIERILRAAMAAPSAVNQQPWEFYVVTNKDTIFKLSKCSDYSMSAKNATVVIVPCSRTKDLIVPITTDVDMAAATENMLLEITAQGLGGVWLGVEPFPERVTYVDKVLGLPEDLHAFALVPVGYPAKEKVQQDRFDESRIHYVK